MITNENSPILKKDLRAATEAIVYTLLANRYDGSIDADDEPIIRFLGDYVRPEQAALDVVQKFMPRG